mmetsp:Transcript_96656/g.171919  ORF Transcript_96656/g.171919 Transcript_96656/m.171919 type:complete len:209 (-) Transcript_96656:90-716(-)|eukprot:CAMPEP_0197654312 /NCGR_PEP_ID=MMETSP1338-20131121/38776_1 /TAXON_ID=43686 ORGANISM="Pelagodinium beii, Strain RCC1491" /NCGR_SAMPLE_ID=MMETSP1338 /ASSEMBLY_ACC=CAM_ASM_000754 /LENGTH=208 /DNA_ID=CAMNT_0043229733 /DNA_START=113 /DNA_END=739 /DNA_ORIENTATION=-
MAAVKKEIRPRELKRLQKELEDIRAASKDAKDGKDGGVTADSVGGDLTRWKASLKGPEGTPYSGGLFEINIEIPADYPYNPPKMKFDTKIWHPNISSQTGAICLDVLGKEWSPALTIRTALLSIQALLSSPEPDDPQDAEVAEMYKSNRELFKQTAKYWTETFAAEQKNSNDQKVQLIVDMGFTAEQAKAALEKHGYDETVALNSLLG